MTLQTRYAELQAAQRVPLYCYKHAPVEADNYQKRVETAPESPANGAQIRSRMNAF
jgi:hypothetical protein